jgi:hypothetical protein
VTTITDSDASTAADLEVSRSPFPFWLAVITVTAESVLAADGTPLTGAFILTPSQPVYAGGWVVVEGSATLTVAKGVATSIVIPCTDAVTPGFTYTITQRLNSPDGISPPPLANVAIPHTLGATVDISALL